MGSFTEDLESIEFSFEVLGRLGDGTKGRTVTAKDDLCNVVTLKQNGKVQCPPKKGLATMSLEFELQEGWFPEVRSSINLKVIGLC